MTGVRNAKCGNCPAIFTVASGKLLGKMHRITMRPPVTAGNYFATIVNRVSNGFRRVLNEQQVVVIAHEFFKHMSGLFKFSGDNLSKIHSPYLEFFKSFFTKKNS